MSARRDEGRPGRESEGISERAGEIEGNDLQPGAPEPKEERAPQPSPSDELEEERRG